MEEAKRLSELTGGAFDITVKPLVDLYQAHQREGMRVPSDDAIQATLDRVDYHKIRMEDRTIAFLAPGMAITLDGIAKGFIVDAGVEELRRRHFTDVLVEAGGDLMASGGRGSRGAWRIGIQPPRESIQQTLARMEVRNQAVATSGDYMQPFSPDLEHHHIISPLTGYSMKALASATVVAPSAMLSDALATALMAMDQAEGLELVESLPGCEAMVVTKNLAFVQTSGFSKLQRE